MSAYIEGVHIFVVLCLPVARQAAEYVVVSYRVAELFV